MNESVTCAAYSPECHGRLEWHHAVKQQRIRRAFKYGAWRSVIVGMEIAGERLWHPMGRHGIPPMVSQHIQTRSLDDILGDTRNRIWLCQAHCDAQFEVPEPAREFCREFGLAEEVRR